LDGKQPRAFDMNFTKPDITARQGTVEDWIIENRATEAHVFHIHQIHFQVLERDGRMVNEPLLRDTIDLPYWDGKSPHYPSLKLRMDFRDPNIVGTFLYHCHILEHEDGGMMGSIRVARPGAKN
jgi:FtsP/CotA-like multicopper oxidase with cupredoxin domain